MKGTNPAQRQTVTRLVAAGNMNNRSTLSLRDGLSLVAVLCSTEVGNPKTARPAA